MNWKPIVPFLIVLCCSLAIADGQQRLPTAYGLLYKEWKAEIKQLDAVDPPLSKSAKRSQKREINETYTPRFARLASAHLDDDLWIDSLIWTSVEGTKGKAFDQMFDILGDNAENAKNTVQLQLLMSEFIKLPSERIDPALRKIATSHPSDGVMGAALYALAARTKIRGERLGDPKTCEEAAELLKRVVSEFPDVSTYRGKNQDNATQLLKTLRSPVAITKKAPGSRGETISGEEFHLTKIVKEKVAVISFSGHWCGPCVAMHPVQKELLDRYPADKLSVIEINSDKKKSLVDVREKIEKDGLNWVIVTDGSDGPISKQWHVSSWPTYYVLDATGRIRHRFTGNIGRKLIDVVDELIPKSE